MNRKLSGQTVSYYGSQHKLWKETDTEHDTGKTSPHRCPERLTSQIHGLLPRVLTFLDIVISTNNIACGKEIACLSVFEVVNVCRIEYA